MNPILKLAAAVAVTLPVGCTLNEQKQDRAKTISEPALVKEVNNIPFLASTLYTFPASGDYKGKLPKLFQLHDFNGNGKIDVPEEALEFYSDKAHYSPCILSIGYNFPYKITKDKVLKVSDWFIKVGNSKDTSSEEKEVCLDVAAELYNYMNNKEFIHTPLPRIFAKFDKDKNGRIDVTEALKFYEERTNIKLERDAKGQVTPKDFRKVIDAFAAYSLGKACRSLERTLNIPTEFSTRLSCDRIRNKLQEQYSELYGQYPSLPAPEPVKLIDR